MRMKTSNFVLILIMGIIALHGCTVLTSIINPGGTLTEWAEQQERDYINIRNTAAADFRAERLTLETYNLIRAACCDYTTASNAAFEEYATRKDSELLQAKVNQAMRKLKAEVETIRGGVK